MKPDLATQIKCVQRELKLRRSAYPAWVRNSRMRQETMDKEIAAMEAVLETLQGVAGVKKEPDLFAK